MARNLTHSNLFAICCMKRILALLSLFTCARAASQDSLQSVADNRNRIMLTGMKVLGSWGALNLTGGSIGWATTTGSDKYFYQMSTFWGGVNLGLAAFGLVSAKRKLGQPISAAENVKAQKKIENIFLFNTGLDMVYTGAGLYMKTRGNKKDNTKLQGDRKSVV